MYFIIIKEKQTKTKILAIGFLPPPLGGISVSFKIFCDLVLKRDDVELKVINLFEVHHSDNFVLGVIKLLIKMWRYTGWSDVVKLYCATSQVPTIALVLAFFCRLRKKPFILRKAAGLDHRDLGPIKGRISEFVVKRTDLYLAQTKHLVQACSNRGIKQTIWFPTTRLKGSSREKTKNCKRFIYVGQVRPSKGLNELLDVAPQLPEFCDIDVYGPFFAGMTEAIFKNIPNIYYKGVLEPDNVQDILSKYDAFVLPSKAHSEGYPGTILEALSVGLPIISTTVGGIPEIVDAECGILIEPGNKKELADAMISLIDDNILYRRLQSGAIEASERFSAVYWTDWLISKCKQLADA